MSLSKIFFKVVGIAENYLKDWQKLSATSSNLILTLWMSSPKKSSGRKAEKTSLSEFILSSASGII